MPSSSPSRRLRSPSPITSASSPHPDILLSRSSLSFGQANTNAGSSPLHKRFDDHKENSLDLGNVKVPERSNQSLKAPPKKPWVTHFAKPKPTSTSTSSPGKRILSVRNKSSSPAQACPPEGNISNKKPKVTSPPPADHELEDSGPVKGVAELSKRIQQFLEDQESLLGVQAASPYSCDMAETSVSLAALGSVESATSIAYDPYNSPFYERPRFLHLQGKLSPITAPEILQHQDTEELPLFDGDQEVVTPLQPVQRSTSLSPLSTEDGEVEKVELSQQQINKEGTDLKDAEEQRDIEASGESITAEEERSDCTHCLNEKTEGDGLASKECLSEKTEGDGLSFQEGTERMPVVSCEEVHQEGPGASPPEINTGSRLSQDVDDKSSLVEAPSAAVDQLQAHVENLPKEVAVYKSEAENFDEGYDVSLAARIARKGFFAFLLVSLVFVFLLAADSPGLLPVPLRSNPVSSLWQSSPYFEPSVAFLRGMEGLWGTSQTVDHRPADIRLVLSGDQLSRSIKTFSHRMSSNVHIHFQVLSSEIADWWKAVLQWVFRDHDSSSHVTRGRQFEWIQEYDFEEEATSFEEDPDFTIAYTGWELMHEFDLQAANRFVLGSIQESLSNDMKRNFSHLSDSADVKMLLEDLMKLNGGDSEGDNMEALQYLWTNAKFSSQHSQAGSRKLPAVSDRSSAESGEVPVNAEQQAMFVEIALATEQILDTQRGDNSEGPDSISMANKLEDHMKNDWGDSRKEISSGPELEGLNTQSMNQGLNADVKNVGNAESPLPWADFSGTEGPVAQETEKDQPAEQGSKSVEDVGNATFVAETEGLPIAKGEFEGPVGQETEKDQPAENGSKSVEDVGNAKFTAETEGLPIAKGEFEDGESEVLSGKGVDSKFETASIFEGRSSILAAAAAAATMVLGAFLCYFKLIKGGVTATAKIPTTPSSVQFLRKAYPPQENVADMLPKRRQAAEDVTMIEELNERFASVLQSPELIKTRQMVSTSPVTLSRNDENLIRSPLPEPVITSPYGSFTTYKMVPKKEGQIVESKLTPVRRSSRLRNHNTMSPNPAKRIAISPP